MAGLVLLAAAFVVFPLDHHSSQTARLLARQIPPGTPLDELFCVIRPFGKGDALFVVGTVLAAMGFRRRAARALLALFLAGVLVWPLKLTVGRPRPTRSDTLSFPSGDSAAIAGFAGAVIAQCPPAAPALTGVILAVGTARVFDGKHYPSDVLAGLGIGALAVAGALVIPLRRLRLRARYLMPFALLIIAWHLVHRAATGRSRVFADFLVLAAPSLALLAIARPLRRAARRWWQWVRGPAGARAAVCTAVALSVLLLAVYGFLTLRSTLWDRDEPRFARAAVEMATSGNYLYPTFNGQLRPDKPILIYWLMSVPIRLLGHTEFACRMVAPLATLAAAWLTFAAGRALFGGAVGPLAFAALAATPLMMVSGTAATTDALLLACTTAAFAALLWAWTRGFGPQAFALLAAALGAALLTKGPVGLAVPLLSGVALALLASDLRGRRARFLARTGAAAAVGIAIFLLWAVPANRATGGEFLRLGIGRHVVQRSLQPLERHGGAFLLSLPYYLPVIAAGFFPWVLFLPAAVAALAGGGIGRRGTGAFLLAWTAPTLLLMALVATKLPHYILPVWPALALAVGGTVDAAQRGALPAPARRWWQRGVWLFAPAGFAAGLGLMVAPWCAPAYGTRLAFAGAGALLCALTALAVRAHRRGRVEETPVLLAAGTALAALTLALSVLPRLEPFKVSPRIARAIREHTADDVPVATYRYGEPSLTFYLDRGALQVLDQEDEVVAWLGRPAPGVLVLPARHLQLITRAHPMLRLEEIAWARGFNYSVGRWIDLVAVGRPGP